MDPDETLVLIRRIVGEVRSVCDDEPDEPFTSEQAQDLALQASALADAVHDLDAWLMRGGYVPEDWKRAANS